MEFTVENICGFLMRSKLLTPEEVRAMYERWLVEGGAAATNLPAFMRWLVERQYVTDYQATLLARGHADDFFLGDYKIVERLGRGRMAGVYKAVHKLGPTVAIKVLPPSRAKNTQLLARFQREARLSLRLKHPNIVRSFQVGESNGLHYLVMECLDGETLDDVLQRRKRLPPAEAVRLLHQALLGLQHIHEQGLVHRDLKPSNLMLVAGPGRPGVDSTLHSTMKILDIGLARELYDENSPLKQERSDLTGEGVLLGTPDYLAPEQASDPRSSDIRADIYSLGCVLYHALAGQIPFPDRNLLQQIVRHATEIPKPLREFNPQIPEGLEQIVNWMIAKKPEGRYPTPQRAAQALEVFLLSGSEAPTLEIAPQMRKYLTWLETEGADDKDKPDGKAKAAALRATPMPVREERKAAPVPVAASAAVAIAPPASSRPVAAAVPATRPAAVPVPPPLPPAPVPAAPVPAAPVPAASAVSTSAQSAAVEPAQPRPRPTEIWQPLEKLQKQVTQLTMRDWILIGIGLTVGLMSCGVLGLMVLLLRAIF